MNAAAPGPQRLEQYELLGLIGQGSMGRVFKARELRLNRLVALKFLASHRLNSPAALERFLREAQTISALSHPNIAVIHGLEEQDGQPFLVLEYLGGGTLSERIRDRRLPLEETLRYARPLALGLEYAHRHGVIHRDVKPSNALFSLDGQLKLVDFGLAKWRSPSGPAEQSGRCGTPGYMAPEQARIEAVDQRSDIFAFGVMLYEMSAGRRPFRCGNPYELLREMEQSDPPSLRVERPDLPPEFLSTVERCLARLPDQRPGSLTEVLAEFDRLERRASGSVSPVPDTPTRTIEPERPESAPEQRRSRRFRRSVAAGALPALLIAAMIWLPPAQRFFGRLSRAPQSVPRLVVVLPFQCGEQPPEAEEFCFGLHIRLASLLVQAEHWQGTISVPPPGELLAIGVRTAEDARKKLGADLAFGGAVLRGSKEIEIVLSLTDTAARRQSGSRILRFPRESVHQRDAALLSSALELLRNATGTDHAAVASAAPQAQSSPLVYELCVRAEGTLRRYRGVASVEAALALAEQAAALDPRSAQALALVAEASVQKHILTHDAADLARARRAAADAAALNPSLREVRMAAGRVAQMEGRYEDAIRELESAAVLARHDQEIQRLLGRVYTDAQRPADAERAYRAAVAVSPAYWPAHSSLGRFLYTRNRYQEAAEEYRTVIRLAPDLPDGYRNLAAMFSLMDREAEAVPLLEESLKRGPAYTAYTTLGAIHFYSGSFDAAAGAYRQALTLQPKAVEAWVYLGEAEEQVPGKRTGSRNAFLQAIVLAEEQLGANPKSAGVLAELAFAHAKLGQAEAARSAAARALQSAAGDSRVRYRLACMEEILGNRRQALSHLARSVELGHPVKRVLREPVLAALLTDPASPVKSR